MCFRTWMKTQVRSTTRKRSGKTLRSSAGKDRCALRLVEAGIQLASDRGYRQDQSGRSDPRAAMASERPRRMISWAEVANDRLIKITHLDRQSSMLATGPRFPTDSRRRSRHERHLATSDELMEPFVKPRSASAYACADAAILRLRSASSSLMRCSGSKITCITPPDSQSWHPIVPPGCGVL